MFYSCLSDPDSLVDSPFPIRNQRDHQGPPRVSPRVPGLPPGSPAPRLPRLPGPPDPERPDLRSCSQEPNHRVSVAPVSTAACTWAEPIIGHSDSERHARRSHFRTRAWAALVKRCVQEPSRAHDQARQPALARTRISGGLGHAARAAASQPQRYRRPAQHPRVLQTGNCPTMPDPDSGQQEVVRGQLGGADPRHREHGLANHDFRIVTVRSNRDALREVVGGDVD